MTRPRDSYKQRAYDAENAVFGNGCRERVVNVPKFLDKMTSTSTWQQNVPEVPSIRWYALTRHARAMGIGGVIHKKQAIRVAKKSPIWLVCHEVAHVVTLAQNDEASWHGAEWAGNYVTLVHWFLGDVFAERLVISLTKHGHPFNASTDVRWLK